MSQHALQRKITAGPLGLLLGGLLTPAPGQAAQTVTASPETASAYPGQAVQIRVGYEATDATLPGLVLRLYYDSDQVRFQEVSRPFDTDRSGPQDRPDDDNGDGDPETDRYVLLSWQDFGGSWPGAVPQSLYTATFKVRSGFSGTTLRFGGEGAAGHALQLPTVNLQRP